MPRTMRVCSTPSCPELHRDGGKCPRCRAEAEAKRGTSSQRGYGNEHRTRFRAAVLAMHPTCTVQAACNGAPSTVADHWPLSRRELVEQGLDPNDPTRGRGTCGPCHGVATAANPAQRGGWNAR